MNDLYFRGMLTLETFADKGGMLPSEETDQISSYTLDSEEIRVTDEFFLYGCFECVFPKLKTVVIRLPDPQYCPLQYHEVPGSAIPTAAFAEYTRRRLATWWSALWAQDETQRSEEDIMALIPEIVCLSAAEMRASYGGFEEISWRLLWRDVKRKTTKRC